MAAKSALFKYVWWIPTSELTEESPTAFLMRQMSKKDVDAQQERTQSMALVHALRDRLEVSEGDRTVKDAMTKVVDEGGFNAPLYKSTVSEIRNIYIEDDLVESITEPAEIVKAIAGLEDHELAKELDDAIWRNSTLEPFEAQNFTSPSGQVAVCRTATEDQATEKLTATSA